MLGGTLGNGPEALRNVPRVGAMQRYKRPPLAVLSATQNYSASASAVSTV